MWKKISKKLVKFRNNSLGKVTHHPNGSTTASRVFHINGVRRWVEIERNLVGMKAREVPQKRSWGNSHGVETTWHWGGQIARQVIWRNGKKHGVDTKWYKSGVKKFERIWIKDKKHGPGTWWDENGIKKWEIYSVDNKKYAQVEWDKKGNVTAVDIPAHRTTTKLIIKLKKSYRKAARTLLSYLMKSPQSDS